MSEPKYIWNQDTLKYEKAELSLRKNTLNVIIFILVSIIFSVFISTYVYKFLIPSILHEEKGNVIIEKSNVPNWIILAGAVLMFIVLIATLVRIVQNRKDPMIFVDKIREDYILLDLPEKYRGLFQDMLRGFEDYCVIKGYEIKISIDNSFTDKIAFKINFIESSNVDEEILRKDYREFTEKLNRAEKFDDLRIEHPKQFQHILQLQNRVNLLENDKRNLEQMLKWQDKFAEKLADPNFKLQPTQGSPIYIQVGDKGIISPSAQTVEQGGMIITGDSNKISNQINISNSFEKRKEQIDRIAELIELLKHESISNQTNSNKLDELTTSLYQLKGSLSKDDNPEPQKMYEWLISIKENAEKLVLVHHTVEAVNWLLTSFGIISG